MRIWVKHFFEIEALKFSIFFQKSHIFNSDQEEKMKDNLYDSYNDFWYGEANIDDIEGLPVEYEDSIDQG